MNTFYRVQKNYPGRLTGLPGSVGDDASSVANRTSLGVRGDTIRYRYVPFDYNTTNWKTIYYNGWAWSNQLPCIFRKFPTFSNTSKSITLCYIQ